MSFYLKICNYDSSNTTYPNTKLTSNNQYNHHKDNHTPSIQKHNAQQQITQKNKESNITQNKTTNIKNITQTQIKNNNKTQKNK